METEKKRSTVTNSLAASALFLVVGLRFNAQGDLIGTIVYSVATILFLLRAGLYYVKREYTY